MRIRPDDARVALLSSGGMGDFLANALAGLQRAGIPMEQVVVGCPPEAEPGVRQVAAGRPIVVRVMDASARDGDRSTDTYLDFGSQGFNRAMWQKVRLVRELLEEHELVVYADLDVAWLRDPLPYLAQVAEAYPMAFQTEAQGRFPPAVCCGFMSMRRSAETLAFLDDMVAEDAVRVRDGRRVGDQEVAQHLLDARPERARDVFPLPEALFVNGLGSAVLPVEADDRLTGTLDPFVFHANWCIGTEHKRALLRASGTWLVEDLDHAPAVEDGAALVTVVYPVFDVRGAEVDRIRLWTREQTADAGAYRLIVVAGGPDWSGSAGVEGLLRDQDALVILPETGREADYWLAGLNRATTPWVLLVEGHAIPERDCVEALLAQIGTGTDAAALNCTVRNPDAHRVSPHMQRWFGELQSAWAEPGTWPRVHRAAFAVRRDVARDGERLSPRYGQFAPPLLSARLHEARLPVRTVAGAVVVHEDSRMDGHREDTVDYVRGELMARTELPAGFMDRYFGPSPLFDMRMQPARIVRDVWTGLARAFAAHPRRAARAGTAAVRLLPWAVISIRLRSRAGRARGHLDDWLAVTRLLPASARWRAFIAGHRRIVRTEELAWVAGREPARLAADGGPREWAVDGLVPGAVIGVHGSTCVDGRPLRWSGPVLVLRLTVPRTGCRLLLRTDGRRPGLTAAHLRVIIDGRLQGTESVRVTDDGTVEVDLGAGGPTRTVVILSHPLREPGAAGRVLGLPLTGVDTRPL